MTAPIGHRIELYAMGELHLLVSKGSAELSLRLLLVLISTFNAACSSLSFLSVS